MNCSCKGSELMMLSGKQLSKLIKAASASGAFRRVRPRKENSASMALRGEALIGSLPSNEGGFKETSARIGRSVAWNQRARLEPKAFRGFDVQKV